MCSDEALSGFRKTQLREIHLGLIHGVDISIYAKPEFSPEQMFYVRIGLSYGVYSIVVFT